MPDFRKNSGSPDAKREATIIFITGGARSGKSKYAQEQALALSSAPLYVATAKLYANDDEFKQRIQRHTSDRDERWTLFEEQLEVNKLPLHDKVVVIDCVTLWLTNFFSIHKYDVENTLVAIRDEINQLQKVAATFFIISNEIGMGLHSETQVGRKFTDLQGWVNQHIAGLSNKVVFMVSGIPVIIKNSME